MKIYSSFFADLEGLVSYLIKSGHLYLPPYDECTLEYLLALMTGEKAFFYTSQVNQVSLTKYRELSMKQIIPMMEQDEQVWKYMVDRGDRKNPRWSRTFALTILSTLKPTFVKQVWDNASTIRLTKP